MAYKSQNNEAEIIAAYFRDYSGGNLLSLGENDGETFSNSYDLLANGWSGVLVEPALSAFEQLSALYKERSISVYPINCGIGSQSEMTIMYQPQDSLLTTTKEDLLSGWAHVKGYDKVQVPFYSWQDFLKAYILTHINFDFISIDCEGMDVEILEQMDLAKLDCKCICVEHSNNAEALQKIKEHCAKFGLTKELLRNGENIILAKND